MKKHKCNCCDKETWNASGRLGGSMSCGCDSAKCGVCHKCHSHCPCRDTKAHIQKLKDAVQERTTFKPSLRERIEKNLGYRGEALRNAELFGDAELLRDALYEAETNMELLTAWTKRATEAEVELTALSEFVASLRSMSWKRKDGELYTHGNYQDGKFWIFDSDGNGVASGDNALDCFKNFQNLDKVD